jgi:hypothetical protein
MFLVLSLVAAGLAIYAYELRHRVALEEKRLAEQAKMVVPAVGGPTTPVTLYLASDADGSVRRVEDSLALPEERSERTRAILRALLSKYTRGDSAHPIGPGSDVRDVFLLGSDTAVVDTSAGFADSHPSGVLAEELTIASMVLTMSANDPRIARVKILVDGKERETLAGHADLSRFYKASDLEFLAKDAK